MKILAKKVSNVMNQKFGKSWICLTGINANFSEINVYEFGKSSHQSKIILKFRETD